MNVFYDTLRRTTPYLEDAWLKTNLFLDQFEKWQIVFFTAVICYLVYRLWDFYDHELDKGFCFYHIQTWKF